MRVSTDYAVVAAAVAREFRQFAFPEAKSKPPVLGYNNRKVRAADPPTPALSVTLVC